MRQEQTTLKRLILVRHGLTANNAAKLIQGTQDIALSAEGRRQAAALAEALAHEEFDHIVSSPQQRALATAEAMAARHARPVHTDVRLRERSFGLFEGGPQQTYQDALAASGQARWDYRPPSGETIGDVWQRTAAFLQNLKGSGVGQPLIAAHEGINRCLILQLLGRPVTEWTTFRQDNCCINEFCFAADGSLLNHAINRTEHLAPIA
jgi:2,3-bisphosphoglycerate-dependent phosphoglycerate mutase